MGITGEPTSDSSQVTSRILSSSSRMLAVDPRIFHPSECTPHDSCGPDLAISVDMFDQ